MGLFQKAVETYDALKSLVGIKVEGKETLAPIGYMIAKASIEITVDAEGNFVRANRIDEKIPIPCTEKSAGRSKVAMAHPLCDNLTYVTGLDEEKHSVYMSEIKNWKESEYGNAKLDAIYIYLLKNSVLEDCKNSQVIECDEHGKVKDDKQIVTWRVEGLGKDSGAVYEDCQMMDSFSKYYILQNNSKVGVCMVTGEQDNLAEQHLKGVSNFCGNAKLISSNDSINFTYRGRFINSSEAMSVGYIASQKAHNAIRWLLSNYGISIGNRRMVCWNPKGKKLPKIDLPLIPMNDKIVPSDYKQQLRKVVNGYKSDFKVENDVVIAAFEAATSGRLSVTYYNELQKSDFLERLYYWDSTCCWYDTSWGVESPALKWIIKLAFGTQRDNGEIECDSRIIGAQMQRIISCRLEKALFPRDIMKNLVIKASNLQIYEKKNAKWLLFVTCAVIKKCKYDYFKEEWGMTLDEDIRDRSYLFGRLLAILEKIESDANGKDEDRETNAIRTQAFYCQRPFTAFSQIMTGLKVGYYPRLSSKAKVYYEKLIGEIIEKLSVLPRNELDKQLTETYLMGYYLQKNSLYTKKNINEKIREE